MKFLLPSIFLRMTFCLMALVMLGQPSQAQQEPNAFRGFRAEGVYDFENIDQVNLYNGSLGVTIPLGLDYPVNGSLSFQLVLRYNSTLFDAHTYSAPCITPSECPVEMQPTRSDNAGLGWRVSLGRILAPGDFWNSTGAWVYVDPSGSEHVLYATLHNSDPEDVGDDPNFPLTQNVLYSRDGSYLRAKRVSSNQWSLEMPDGQKHTFANFATSGDSDYRLTKIEDPFDNTIDVGYDTENLTWTITDPHRTYTVNFVDPGAAFPNQPRLVDTIEMPCFQCTGQAVSEVEFHYSPQTATRPPGHTHSGRDVDVQVLDRIDLPEGLSYTFAAYGATGQLTELILPTRGRIEWDWAPLTFPSFKTQPSNQNQDPEPYNFVYAVSERRHEHADGTLLGAWKYDRYYDGNLANNILPEKFTVELETPLGDEEHHFFSVFPAIGSLGTPRWGTKINEFGLPYTREFGESFVMGMGERFLSTEIYDCDSDGTNCVKKRSIYVEYEFDDDTNSFDRFGSLYNKNRRLKSRLTEYHDDAPNYLLEVFDDFDGLGNYRKRSVMGSFQSDAGRTTFTQYNGDRNTYGDTDYDMVDADESWILGTYSFQERTEAFQQTRQPELEGADHPGFDGGLRGTSNDVTGRVETTFDLDTGVLQCRRRLEIGTDRGSSDILEVFDYDTVGNMVLEKTYGGDLQDLPTTEGCHVGDLDPEYQRNHTYASGALQTTAILDACGDEYLPLFDNTIDAKTGLVASSLDTTEQVTTLGYDTLGRITSIEPTGDAGSYFEYTNASGTNAAKIESSRRFNENDNPGITLERFLYDGFGRVCKELVRMPGPGPNDWSRRDHVYHAQGWKKETSERIGGNGSGTTCITGLGAQLFPTKYQNYDPFGRVGNIVPPDDANHAIDFGYVGVRQKNRTVRIATGTGGTETQVVTQERYDPHGRLRRVIEDQGDQNVETEYAYNVDGGLREVAQGAQTRTFSIDRRGFLLSETHPELGVDLNGTLTNNTITYSLHDSTGSPGRRTDGVRTLDYTHDAAQRLIRVADGTLTMKEFIYYKNNASGQRSRGKLYQAKRHNRGLPVSPLSSRMSGPDLIVTETYNYAGLGGRISERQTTLSNRGQAVGFTTQFTWDALGNLAITEYPNCLHDCGDEPGRLITNVYDNGLLTGITGYAPSITYHPNGMVHEITHGNSVITTQLNDPHAIPRPASIGFSGGTVGWTLGGGNYAYDGAGNIEAIGNDTFRYDVFNRLVDANLASVSRDQQYTYDHFGNITQVTTDNMSSTIGVSNTSNCLTNTTYDAAGNLTYRTVGSQPQQFDYDVFDMIQTFQTDTQAKGYVYTAHDERLVEFDFTRAPWVETWSIRDLEGKILRQFEAVGEDWAWQKDYIHRAGQQLASLSSSEGARYLHLDHLGTTRLITDANGAEVSRHTYFPFGEEAATPGVEQLQFTGHERDANGPGTADDLDYMHARYYSPQAFRFLSVDPVGGTPSSPQTWNRYTYVTNNPIKFIDPFGLFPCPGLEHLECHEEVTVIEPKSTFQGLPQELAFPRFLDFLSEEDLPPGFLGDVRLVYLERFEENATSSEGTLLAAAIDFVGLTLFIPTSEAEIGLELAVGAALPGSGPIVKSFSHAVRKLGLNPKRASATLHRVKKENQRGGKDNVLFDTSNGNIIEPETGKVIGNLSDEY